MCRPFYIYFPFVLIATILGMYIVITVKSDAEHQTRVMESMIANEISMERSRHIRTLKNTYREIYRVPGCGRGYEVTEAWGCNIQGKYVQLWFSQGYSGFHLYRITGYGNLSCCIWIRICDGRRFCSLSDHRNCWKPVSFKTCEYFDSLECKSPAIPAL